ncbi:hypothetical protein IQ254_12060 [Nodosilinea sp. LEGE 07088]|uniref:beta strand repeat-containing protein n=1 Tax=Nodosilinea sp. LEGE 07088 TaxID=2777968 RepID=UPI00187EC5DD|nr:hypothetical protein [Nodosilinea sp. LEGE 07088]MBE9137918.1 hypothetical protein [Nodosilinea sp. LEGE 07088]
MKSIEIPLHSHWYSNKVRPLLITAIAASGVFQFLAPVLAGGTTAGTDIINRATATYSDGTTNFNAISNTVTVKVDEVRGLTVTDAGFTDANGGSIATSDNLYFDFLVTNTGNADAFVYIPGATALGPMATGGNITAVQIIEVNGTALGAPITVPAGGNSTNNLAAGFPNTTGVIPADGNFKVRVTMAVTATNAGDPVKVQFGTTADNTPNTQDQQNIAFSTDTAPTTNDVYTLDANGTLAPANGEREAAASHQEFVATAPRPLAQTTLLMTSTTAPGANANSAVDDTITYDLDFRVNNNPQPGFPAGSLEGTTINLDTGGGATPTQRILVSTTVPPNTVWNGTAPLVPNGNWIPVYSTDDAYTGAENPINGVTWTTTPPAPGTVKRIGFIYDAGANGALPPGTAVNDFRFTVVTSGLPATGGSVANIGQIFGETLNDPANNLVYDESGDQDANNYDDGVFPPNPNISDFVANPQTGAANPNDPDTNGNNTGTGPNGEANVIGILPLPPANSALLNGPNNVPNAIGPTNVQDDFTNVATTVDTVGVQGSASNPTVTAPITNTVRNTIATNLDNVKLLPFAPDATRALTSGVHGVDRNSNTQLNDEIPDGTTVTIRFGAQTAAYTYTAAGGFAPVAANPPVVIGTLTPGQQQSYTVTIDLPANTPQIQGYTLPIVAFVDNDSSNSFVAATDTVYNFTNNRVYPGFINLVKAARILDTNGTTQLDPAGPGPSYTNTPTVRPRPGQFVEYRITYQNISESQPASGGGNVLLTGNGLVINEDGATAPNTWAGVTTHRQNTAATLGTLQFYNGAVLLGPTDPASGAAVTRYVNTIPSLAPQVSGTLTFRRIVN